MSAPTSPNPNTSSQEPVQASVQAPKAKPEEITVRAIRKPRRQDHEGGTALTSIRQSRTAEGKLYQDLTNCDSSLVSSYAIDPLDLAEEVGLIDLALTMSHYGVSLLDKFEEELGILPTEERSQGNGDYLNGLPANKDRNRFYRPFEVRGNGIDHGLYEQLWREEVHLRRHWDDLLNVLIGGHWWVAPADASEEEAIKAQWVADAIFDVQGGWDEFLEDALYSIITGFSLFEEVYNEETLQIDKFAFRYSGQVREWIFDEGCRNLIAVKLTGANGAGEVTLPAHRILLLSHGGFGIDPEGASPLRAVAQHVQALSMIYRLEQLSAEKYGTPIIVIEGSDKALPGEDSDLLNEILDKMSAEDLVVLEVPDGRTVKILSPNGNMPDFSAQKEYYEKLISLAYMGEGGNLGQNGTGSYALAEVADNKVLRSIPAYARRICNVLNGSRGRPYTGTIRKMIDARFGKPENGRYPKLKFALASDPGDEK